LNQQRQVSGMGRCILVLVKTGIGVTNNLERRVYEHKNNIVKGFTSKYSVHQLMYYEETNDIQGVSYLLPLL